MLNAAKNMQVSASHGWTINFGSSSGAKWIYYFFAIFFILGCILGVIFGSIIMELNN